MKQVKIVFETNGKKVGYLLNLDSNICTSGKFNDNLTAIEEESQSGVIDNPQEISKQIYFVILAALNDK